jgi:hypothetical protein
LAALPNLNGLSAEGVRLTAANLRPFRNRPNLDLRADYDRSDAGLREYREAGVLHILCALEELPGPGGEFLRTLDLTGSPVSDAGLAALADLPGVECLLLGDTAITDEGLKHLGGPRDLVELRLNATAVTDLGVRQLAGISNLKFLDLAETKVTDAGLQELQALKRLRVLNLLSTPTTEAGRRELRRALPDCELGACRTRFPR